MAGCDCGLLLSLYNVLPGWQNLGSIFVLCLLADFSRKEKFLRVSMPAMMPEVFPPSLERSHSDQT